jgi:DNA-binding transcriptional LysR family regulator
VEGRRLEWLARLVEERSLARAAARLDVPENELDRAIRALEHEAGLPLVVRSGPAIDPTAAGEALVEHWRERVAAGDVAALPARIGCVPQLPLMQLQEFLGALFAHDPSLQAEVAHLPSAEQVTRLDAGRLDVGIVHEVGNQDGVRLQPLFPGQPLVVFLPIGHRLAGPAAIGPGELAGEVLRCVPQAEDQALAVHLLGLARGAGHRFRALREITGTGPRDLLLTVAQADGVALGTRSSLRAAGDVAELVHAVPLEPAVLHPGTALAWRSKPDAERAGVLATVQAAARRLREG